MDASLALSFWPYKVASSSPKELVHISGTAAFEAAAWGKSPWVAWGLYS